MISKEDNNRLKLVREQQIDLVRSELALISSSDIENEIEKKIRQYAEQEYKLTHEDFDELWDLCLDKIRMKDKPFFDPILRTKGLDDIKLKQLDKILCRLK